VTPRFCSCDTPQPELVEGVRVCANAECGRQVADPRDRLLVLIAKQQHQLLAKLDRLERGYGPEDEQRTEETPARPNKLHTPAELARELGVSRDFVYEHAEQLGVSRPGDGPKPRLYFDLERARGRLAALATTNGSKPQEPERRPPRRRRQRKSSTELLPVKGRAAA
jgi:hypothetical protein